MNLATCNNESSIISQNKIPHQNRKRRENKMKINKNYFPSFKIWECRNRNCRNQKITFAKKMHNLDILINDENNLSPLIARA